MQTFLRQSHAITAAFFAFGAYTGLIQFFTHDVSLAVALVAAISVFLCIDKAKGSFDTTQDQKLAQRRQN